MRETEMEVPPYCYVKHKNPEPDGYERDRSLRSEKLKRNEITITETTVKTETKTV